MLRQKRFTAIHQRWCMTKDSHTQICEVDPSQLSLTCRMRISLLICLFMETLCFLYLCFAGLTAKVFWLFGSGFRNCKIKSIAPYGVFVEIAPGREVYFLIICSEHLFFLAKVGIALSCGFWQLFFDFVL